MRESQDPDRITKLTSVGEALNSIGSEPVIVSESTPLRQVAADAEQHPAVRLIAVTDVEGRLAGIIRIPDLCEDLFMLVAPEDFIADILRPGRLEEYGRIARARTAGELMEEPASVEASDRLAEAFSLMHERKLDGVIVIDSDRRPVAYLDRFRLIAVWLRTHPG